MEVLRSLRLAKSRKLHECCTELELWAGRDHVAIDDARAVAGIMGYLSPRLWSIASPAPAPSWPKPEATTSLKPRATAEAPEPTAPVGRHFRVPRDLGVAEAAATTYLGLLDYVVDDGRVTANEVDALALFAKSCGITRDVARRLHLAYLEEMTRLATADGVVTADEQTYLANLVPLLTAALPN
jgi:DNA polymerase-3 subunit epsilon